MKLVIGIGNPGKEYDDTRHNVGFMAIDYIAECENGIVSKPVKNIQSIRLDIENERLLLIKPLTYVNNSGIIFPFLKREYQAQNDEMLVICDDVNLPVGKLRIRRQGTSGGHNGLKSIEGALGNNEFPRARIGVGGEEHHNMADYVLGRFKASERPMIDEALKNVHRAIRTWVQSGLEQCMNNFN